MHAPPDPLDPLLERWREMVPPLDPPVGGEVWQGIEAAQTARETAGWRARLEAVFAQPSFAVAFVTACLLLGLFLAELRLSRLQADRNTQLARSYVQWIDPMLAPPPSPVRANSLRP